MSMHRPPWSVFNRPSYVYCGNDLIYNAPNITRDNGYDAKGGDSDGVNLFCDYCENTNDNNNDEDISIPEYTLWWLDVRPQYKCYVASWIGLHCGYLISKALCYFKSVSIRVCVYIHSAFVLFYNTIGYCILTNVDLKFTYAYTC